MNHSVEKKENNSAIVTIEVSSEELKEALKQAYNKTKNRIQVPGFRKGKASMQVIEKLYGPEVFYEDAVNYAVPKYYDEFLETDHGLEITSRPRITVGDIDKEKGFSFTSEVALKPEVVLGKYLEVEVPFKKEEVKDEDIEKQINQQREANAREFPVEDEPAKMGDICNINFEGFLGDEPFQGGKGENYPLTLGSNSFIPGFEDQLVGAKAGDDVEVKVTFPEDYHADELKGKEAIFKCHVNEIKRKEVPELNDEFVKDVSEFDTVEEYKKDIREKLEKSMEERNKRMKENALLEIIVEDSNADIHELMIDSQAEQILDDHRTQLQRNGLSLEQYLQLTGFTMEDLMTNVRQQALTRIKTRLVLEAIAKAEKVEVSDKEVDERLEEIAKAYNMELDKFKEVIPAEGIDQMKEDLAIEKAVDMLLDSAIEVEPKEEEAKQD